MIVCERACARIQFPSLQKHFIIDLFHQSANKRPLECEIYLLVRNATPGHKQNQKAMNFQFNEKELLFVPKHGRPSER